MVATFVLAIVLFEIAIWVCVGLVAATALSLLGVVAVSAKVVAGIAVLGWLLATVIGLVRS